MSSYRVMPDGSRCYSGPNCSRHSAAGSSVAEVVGKQLKEAKQAVKRATGSTGVVFPAGGKRVGSNTVNPGWAESLYKQSRLLEETIEGEEKGLYDAVWAYTGVGYKRINAYLHNGEDFMREQYSKEFSALISAESVESMVERTREDIAAMGRAFQHEVVFDEPLTLYRAASFVVPQGDDEKGGSLLDQVKATYKVGSVVERAGYSSASADPDCMLFYAREKHGAIPTRIVFEIVAKRGLPILAKGRGDTPWVPREGDIQSFEREVLLNRDSKFRVVNVRSVTFEHSFTSEGPSTGGIPSRFRFPVIQVEQL